MSDKSKSLKDKVEEQLKPAEFKEFRSTAYSPAIPIVPQDFSMGGILPAVLYMFRWGHRRGKGKFINVFGNPDTTKDSDNRTATTEKIAQKMSADDNYFVGFSSDTENNILADMLLAYCFENKNHQSGREQQVQRVYPTHYFASWIDLPKDIANLRNVPEMLVSILSRKKDCKKGFFQIYDGELNNLLLSIFAIGTEFRLNKGNLKSDIFDESIKVGIDQLLTIRISNLLGEAPIKIKSKSKSDIPYQVIVAEVASKQFYEDFNIFLRAYGEKIPRLSLLPMMESCLSIGFTNIYLSTLSMIHEWEKTGTLPNRNKQKPWPLFIDCSSSQNSDLRRFSETCMDDLIRRLARMPVCFICLRILDYWASKIKNLKDLPDDREMPLKRIDFLGEVLNGFDSISQEFKTYLEYICNPLANSMDEEESQDIRDILLNEELHPAWRMSEVLFLSMNAVDVLKKFRIFLDNSLMIDQPNGIAVKWKASFEGNRNTDRRSIILTNSAIDYLVHRHIRKERKNTTKRCLSISEFLEILKKRYGFYIDESPPGLSVPSDLLKKNREFLERRLRDLGLFVGVNDAESMKRLKARFSTEEA